MSIPEDNFDDLADGLLERDIRNPEPDTSIYTDPATFGTNAGEELDKAFPEDNDSQTV